MHSSSDEITYAQYTPLTPTRRDSRVVVLASAVYIRHMYIADMPQLDVLLANLFRLVETIAN